MKLNEIMDIEHVIAKHTIQLKKLAEKEVDDLSISEMAFIKIVSSGSITTMKKNGASNERILVTDKKTPLSNDEKIKLYLKSLSPDHLAALLDNLKD